ncbi:MAG TPA: 2OG-Fe(II) oxygenase [Rhizomicrobium sp.]|jgi:prolyl 4-hydroxylase|nr:2OG-Fe(II) oxygenase [Rhizomicrobium sp.]
MDQDLMQRAKRGDTEAQFALAMEHANAGQARDALTWMTKAADGGAMIAEAQLGIWQLLGMVAERNTREGLKRIRKAARAGDDISCLLLSGLNAMGILAPQDWTAARDWLIEAARLGNVRALTQLSLLLPEDFAGREAFALKAAASGYAPAAGLFDVSKMEASDLDAAKAALNLAQIAAVPIDTTTERDGPRLQTARGFLPEPWCRYIRALAEPLLVPSDVHNAALGRTVLGVRTSSHMAFGAADTDPLLAIVSHRIARWTATHVACGEHTTVLRYRPGEEYRRHVDYFDPAIPTIWAEAQRAGQRELTVLVWLNDDFGGGETEFPLADFRFRGQTGDALAFWNVLPDGAPDRRTTHAGLPVQSGEKWLISKWIRARAQEP